MIPHASPMRGYEIDPAQYFETVVAIGEVRAGIDGRGKMMPEQARAVGKN